MAVMMITEFGPASGWASQSKAIFTVSDEIFQGFSYGIDEEFITLYSIKDILGFIKDALVQTFSNLGMVLLVKKAKEMTLHLHVDTIQVGKVHYACSCEHVGENVSSAPIREGQPENIWEDEQFLAYASRRIDHIRTSTEFASPPTLQQRVSRMSSSPQRVPRVSANWDDEDFIPVRRQQNLWDDED